VIVLGKKTGSSTNTEFRMRGLVVGGLSRIAIQTDCTRLSEAVPHFAFELCR